MPVFPLSPAQWILPNYLPIPALLIQLSPRECSVLE